LGAWKLIIDATINGYRGAQTHVGDLVGGSTPGIVPPSFTSSDAIRQPCCPIHITPGLNTLDLTIKPDVSQDGYTIGNVEHWSGELAVYVVAGVATATPSPTIESGIPTGFGCVDLSTIFVPEENAYFSQWPSGWPAQGYGSGHWLHANLRNYRYTVHG